MVLSKSHNRGTIVSVVVDLDQLLAIVPTADSAQSKLHRIEHTYITEVQIH